MSSSWWSEAFNVKSCANASRLAIFPCNISALCITTKTLTVWSISLSNSIGNVFLVNRLLCPLMLWLCFCSEAICLSMKRSNYTNTPNWSFASPPETFCRLCICSWTLDPVVSRAFTFTVDKSNFKNTFKSSCTKPTYKFYGKKSLVLDKIVRPRLKRWLNCEMLEEAFRRSMHIGKLYVLKDIYLFLSIWYPFVDEISPFLNKLGCRWTVKLLFKSRGL